MPRAFCPHFDIRCHVCGGTVISLVRDAVAGAYCLECQACHTTNVLVYDGQTVPPLIVGAGT